MKRVRLEKYLYYLVYDFLSLKASTYISPVIYDSKEEAIEAVEKIIQENKEKAEKGDIFVWVNIRPHYKKVLF